MILRRCRSPRGRFAGCGDARRQTKIGRIRQSRRVAPQILASGRSGAGCGASGTGRFRTRERPCGDGPRRGGRSVFEASAVRKLKYERVRSALCHACAVPRRLFQPGKMRAGLLLRPLIPIFAGAVGRRAGRWRSARMRSAALPQPAAAFGTCVHSKRKMAMELRKWTLCLLALAGAACGGRNAAERTDGGTYTAAAVFLPEIPPARLDPQQRRNCRHHLWPCAYHAQ